jgi:hypothetical protein
MDLNQGKVLFASFDEASRVSAQMRKNKGERFQPYRVDGGWAIGGKHLKKISPVQTKIYQLIVILVIFKMS